MNPEQYAAANQLRSAVAAGAGLVDIITGIANADPVLQ
jgi:hypothetical protein